MMSVTHAAIALTTTSITLGTADAATLGISLIGSQLPDLDKSDSFCGRVLFPISQFLESRFAHRTITHSFLSTGAIALISLPLWLIDWHLWAGLVLGQFTGWFADCFTKSGTAAFYPSPVRLVIPGNPRARLRSGSTYEYWVMGTAIALAIISINLASAGGLTEQFAKAFFSDTSTAASLFQRYGSERVVTVEVEGLHSYTSQAIQSRYMVLEASSSDIVGQEEITGKLYKIGKSPDTQIRPNRVKANVGDPITITAREQLLRDVPVSAWIAKLPQNAYISGSIILEEMSELAIAASFEEFDVIRNWGGQVELRHARPSQIAAQLGEFWIVQGKAIVKERK